MGSACIFGIARFCLNNHRRTGIIYFACVMFLSILETRSDLFYNPLSAFDDTDPSHYTLSRNKRSDPLSSISDAQRLIPLNYSIHEPPPKENVVASLAMHYCRRDKLHTLTLLSEGRSKITHGSATMVGFYVLIVDIRDVNEVKEELSLEMNLQMYWKDTRLSHLTDQSSQKSFVVLNPVLIGHLWHPDIYIDHAIKVDQPNYIAPPVSLRIYPDSTIRYSARLTVTIACQMDFHFYPADTQRCNVDFKSYAYMNKILALDWREGKEAAIKKKLIVPNFEVGLGNKKNFSVVTSSGVYSSIRFTVILRRYISFHLIQTYLPSALFVIVSFLSFLVAPESIPGRMTLCMTTLLTLTSMFSSVKQATPSVSYVKGLDVWMVTCICFVFFVLLEYTILLKLKYLKPKDRKRRNRQKQGANNQIKEELPHSNQNHNGLSEPVTGVFIRFLESPNSHLEQEKKSGYGNGINGVARGSAPASVSSEHPKLQPTDSIVRKTKHEDISLRVEQLFSRIIPGSFVLFNLIYWPWLVLAADYYNETEFQTTNYAE